LLTGEVYVTNGLAEQLKSYSDGVVNLELYCLTNLLYRSLHVYNQTTTIECWPIKELSQTSSNKLYLLFSPNSYISLNINDRPSFLFLPN